MPFLVFVVGEMGNGKAFVSGLEGGYDSGRQAGPFTTQTSYSTKPAEKYMPCCLFNSLLSVAGILHQPHFPNHFNGLWKLETLRS